MEVNRNSIINKDVLKCFLQCDLDGVGVSILVAAIEYQIVIDYRIIWDYRE